MIRRKSGPGDFDENQSKEEETPTLPLGPGVERSPATHFSDRLPGENIGEYDLVRLIGEGGFGSVFLAKQKEPVRRNVAIKILKASLDSEEIVARFESERHALALIDHPGVANVFDAGSTDSGQPYFVMEFVDGLPITEFCDSRGLGVRDRVMLIIDVCRTVQHAHQKGVIHRDIKPSNILVFESGGKPATKIIDFGVAKSISQNLLEAPAETIAGQLLGTPQYMSPEQAACVEGVDIDTRSDIYSLGALLYEILTGVSPFSAGELRKAGLQETLRIVREETPPKPSTRIRGWKDDSGNSLETTHRLRPEALARKIEGDLDWVIMRALEKDRERRYSSADGLAEDLERYLSDDPVSAGPPSLRYRLAKFASRNRMFLVFVSVIVVLIIVGGTVSAALAIRERRANLRVERLNEELKLNLYATELGIAYDNFSLYPAESYRILEKQIPSATRASDLRGWEWFYLWGKVHERFRSMPRKKALPSGAKVALEPPWEDGSQKWGIASRDGLEIWNPDTDESSHSEILPNPHSLKWSPDGSKIAVATFKRFQIFDSERLKLLEEIETDRPFTAFAWNPSSEKILTASIAGEMSIHSTRASGESTVFLPARKDGSDFLREVDWSSYSDQIAALIDTGHTDDLDKPDPGVIEIWDTKELRRIGTLPRRFRASQTVFRWSPTADLLAVWFEGRLEVYDTSGADCETIHTEYPFGLDSDIPPRMIFDPALEWSADGNSLVAGGEGVVAIWRLGEERSQLKEFAKLYSIKHISWLESSNRLLVQDSRGTLGEARLDEPTESENTEERSETEKMELDQCEWASDLSRSVSTTEKGAIYLTDEESGRILWSEPESGSEINVLSWSPDNTMIVTKKSNEEIFRIRDAGSGVTKLKIGQVENSASSIRGFAAWSPDSSRIAIASDHDKRVKIINPKERKVIAVLPNNGRLYTENLLSWSPDGKFLAVASSMGDIDIWNVEIEEVETSIREQMEHCSAISWHPEKPLLAVSGRARTRVFSVADMTEVLSFPAASRSRSGRILWNADGSRILFTESAGDSEMYETRTGQHVGTFTHFGTGTTWSADDERIATLYRNKKELSDASEGYRLRNERIPESVLNQE